VVESLVSQLGESDFERPEGQVSHRVVSYTIVI